MSCTRVHAIGLLLLTCILHAIALPSRSNEDCRGLDKTCGGWNHEPCCPGLTCRKVRDGNTYGRCSFSLLELHYPIRTVTTTTSATVSTEPFT
ncbi:expressed conserved protein [Echinococcus multilocularis]|uniref:Expressed conserved protein n=1 Tax=Echinococcus multilocularis TaxID=6211 RepID=A0A068Y4I6_ECHMU|nr:expressed conserved protein [Echinococcus multilocularis]